MSIEVKNRVVKTELVEWRNLKILQPETLKRFTDAGLEALKKSILENDFVCTFKVWQENEDNIWVIDGTHRLKVLELLASDGEDIPDRFTADFIDCEDRKQAANFVLVYSSQYAKVTQGGLDTFLATEDISFNYGTLDIPSIDVSKYADPEYMAQVNEMVFVDDQSRFEGVDSKGNAFVSKINKCCPKCGNGSEDIINVRQNG